MQRKSEGCENTITQNYVDVIVSEYGKHGKSGHEGESEEGPQRSTVIGVLYCANIPE